MIRFALPRPVITTSFRLLASETLNVHRYIAPSCGWLPPSISLYHTRSAIVEIFDFGAVFLLCGYTGEGSKMCHNGPVSYTHLDVYKRQAPMCASIQKAGCSPRWVLFCNAGAIRSKCSTCLLYTSGIVFSQHNIICLHFFAHIFSSHSQILVILPRFPCTSV